MSLEGRMRGKHAGGWVAPDCPREVAARNFQQLTAATADIQPSLRPRSQARAFQELFDQEPFPAVEMERIFCESIPSRIIEQLSIGGRILVKLGTNGMAS